MKLMDYQILTKYNIILKSHQSLLKEERERREITGSLQWIQAKLAEGRYAQAYYRP